MGKVVVWDKNTGDALEYDGIDAREILAQNPELYTDVDPKAGAKGKDPDKDGKEGTPQNVANVENEFRREAVGADNPPAVERSEVIIRNPVTDQPRMALPAGSVPPEGEAMKDRSKMQSAPAARGTPPSAPAADRRSTFVKPTESK